MVYEKSCGAVVYLKDDVSTKILLLKHNHGGHWSFPKGHVEQDETEYETALREIKEETGLDVALEPEFRSSVRYYPKKDTSKVVVYFLAKADNADFERQEEEISEIRWVDIDDALDMITYKKDKNVFKNAVEFLKSKNI